MTFPIPALSNLNSVFRSNIPPKPFVELIDLNGKKTFAIHNCDWDGDKKAEDAYVDLIYRGQNIGSMPKVTFYSSKNKNWVAPTISDASGDGTFDLGGMGIVKCDIPVNGKFEGMNDVFYLNTEVWSSGTDEYIQAMPFIDPNSLKAVNPNIEIPHSGFNATTESEIKKTHLDGTADKVHDSFDVSHNGMISDFLTKNYVQMLPLARGNKIIKNRTIKSYMQGQDLNTSENKFVSEYNLNFTVDETKKICSPQGVLFNSASEAK